MGGARREMKDLDARYPDGIVITGLAPRSTCRKARAGLFFAEGRSAHRLNSPNISLTARKRGRASTRGAKRR